MSYEYLFAALPSLPREPGAKLRITAAGLVRMCDEEGGRTAALARALCMSFDIRAMERMARGAGVGETAVFEPRQLEEYSGFPEWLVAALRVDASTGRYRFDSVWAAYYGELWSLAHQIRSRFLREWISWDWGLKKAVAVHRASEMKVEIEEILWPYGDDGSSEWAYDYRPAVDALISIEDRGFEAWRMKDRMLASMRLARARQLAPEYTFDLNELASYIVQFCVMKEVEYLGR